MKVQELFEEKDENIYDALKHLFKDKSASAKNLDEFAKQGFYPTFDFG